MINRDEYNKKIWDAPKPLKYSLQVWLESVGNWVQYVGSYEFCRRIRANNYAYADNPKRQIRPYV